MSGNLLDRPLPRTAAEIRAAMDELDLFPAHAMAEIFEPDPPFDGWFASISDAETDEKAISTVAFPSREALEAALKEAGITQIEEAW